MLNASLHIIFSPPINSVLLLCTAYLGRLVLKRYYNFLWKNFPQDHLVSLGRLCKLVPLSDDVVDDIVSSSSSEEGNQKLLNICVVMIETDESLPRFCNLVDKIIDNPKLSKMMKIFRDGT